MRTLSLPFYARIALILLSVVLVCVILRVAGNIFIPLVFALLVSILLFPVNMFFERRLRFGRVLSPVSSVLLFLLMIAGFLYFLIVQMISFSKDFPVLKKRFLEMFSGLQHWITYKMAIPNYQQNNYLDRSANAILEAVGNSVGTVVGTLLHSFLLFVFVLIFTFFMLFHRRLLLKFVLHLFRVDNREKVKEVIIETKAMINSYVVGLVIEMVVISFVNCCMFMIMGIDYALLLGVMAAVLNVIPYLGIYTAMAICMLVTFANSSGNMALEVGVGLFVVHLLDANILFPRIVGGRVKMNPFITIVAVIVGEFLWGVPGMFLFIPITGILKLICARVEGLEAWAILIGVEDNEKPVRKVHLNPSPPAE